jgi:hypothetical protein
MPVTPEGVQNISLRHFDREEVMLTMGLGSDVHEGIVHSVESSEEAWVVVINGDHQAYFGVTSIGGIWFLGTSKIFQTPDLVPVFQIITDVFLDMWLERYGSLWNATLTKNITAVKWLESKGFLLDNCGEWTKFRKDA